MPRAPTQSHTKQFLSTPYPNMSYTSTQRGLSQPAAVPHERASVAWSTDDDNMLMEYRAKGFNWSQIASYFTGKTSNACRKRHERLMEKKNFENYDTVKTEDLAHAYMECREEMWKIMATKLGESKWQTLETKVLEKGLKNLQTAHRSRKGSRVTHASSPGNSHHSGETSFGEDPSLGQDFETHQHPVAQHNGNYSLNGTGVGQYQQSSLSYPYHPTSNSYVTSTSYSMPPPSVTGNQTLPPLSQGGYTPTASLPPHLPAHLPSMFSNHMNYRNNSQMITSSYA